MKCGKLSTRLGMKRLDNGYLGKASCLDFRSVKKKILEI